jgi:hypothetical protein
VEANSTGGQGSRRAVVPSDDDDSLRGFYHIFFGMFNFHLLLWTR